jgi:hypothetical protein
MRVPHVAGAAVLAAIISVSSANAQDIPADLTQARADRREAMIRGNPANFDKLTAASWVSVDAAGKVENKAERASRIVAPATPPQGPLAPPQRLNERISMFNNDTVIFFWQQTVAQGLQNFTETWIRENGQWKCAAQHQSLPVAPAPAAGR